ncbi:transcription cofactor vestigial-like protein 2b isoform X1 [Periophthalmus magnuspinnatus]|uniref:transcription cofactor vestigial-like protein 2b isoform X1 n=2 Tax=Periophthalmus magnuspinnatus TaxID=409849 RepID=UPI00145C1103|nr:transcription cofactor vestigial-like protein 2b isoform X1 [Periophthalmus magnuspinnatus]
MSCLDVMYPAYGHYAPYAPSAPAFINSLQAPTAVTPSHCRDRMDTSRGPDGLPGGPGNSSSSSTSSSSTASSLSSPASSYITAGTRSEEGPKDKSAGAPEAEYLSSRCVLFTYYQGDISSVVDQHFSRALSSYMDGEGKRRAPETHGTDAASPSGRRSFPPSFWDSNYPSPQSRPHCDPTSSYSVDPYASGLHPGLSHPHAHPHAHPHPPESWAYTQPQYGPPRSLHELYSPSALEPHYGPLLMPAVRPPHLPAMPGHYEVSKLEPPSTWPSLLPTGEVGQSLTLNMDTGLPQHKKAKELYWF